jgi:hypothetical protein
MDRFARSWLWIGVQALACIVLAGCSAFGDMREALKATGRSHITMDSPVLVQDCGSSIAPPGIRTQTCPFKEANTGQTITSVFNLAGLLAGDVVLGRPLIIIQVPADASAFLGTYDDSQGHSGALTFTPGNAELAVDATTTLAAEPGMQLVTVELPPAAPDGTYFMVLSYDASTPQIKGMSSTRVTASGRTYHPSALPCTSSMASVPEIPIPNTPVATHIDVHAIAPAFVPCSGGKTYDYSIAPQIPVTVVEYYNAALDHYFITWHADEIAILDAGVQIRGWMRTGKTFKAYGSAYAGTSDICRYYLPPAFGDSHFFGRGTAECNATGLAHPAFVLEDAKFMAMFLPTAGNCPVATSPVYRVFSNRADANHRYMTDRATRDQMVAAGWLAEGDGPDLVVMCAPV